MFDLMQYALIFYDFQLILAQMGGPPRTSAPAGTPATPPPAGRVLKPLGCAETQVGWGSPAAEAARGTA
jgi:hypothetical protein